MQSTVGSLTLRALLEEAAARAGFGRGAASAAPSIRGLSLSAQAFAAAARAGRAPVVLVVPGDADVERMTTDVRFFLTAIERLAHREAERGVLPFSSPEVDPYRGLAPHLEVASSRARALAALARGHARVLVASAPALLPRPSPPDRLLAASVELRLGGSCSPTDLGDRLADAGFARADPVEAHGEFCGRGGLVDLFPAGDPFPVRIEFVGDNIESLRRFDPATQRSVETLDHVSISPLTDCLDDAAGSGDLSGAEEGRPVRRAAFDDYVRQAGARFVVSQPEETAECLQRAAAQVRTSHADAASRGDAAPPPDTLQVDDAEASAWLAGATTLDTLDITPDAGSVAASAAHLHVACQPAMEFRGRLRDWITDVERGRDRGDTQVFVAETSGRAERIVELLAEHDLVGVRLEGAEDTGSATVLVTTGTLSRGFRLPAAGLQIFAETDLFEAEHVVRHQRRSVARSFLSDFRDLKVGDHVVHVDHGVGEFVGLREVTVPETRGRHEFVELRYARGDKLLVPVEQLELLQKYTGGAHPKLDRLGGTTWAKTKTRVRKSMRDMTGELLKLYAARQALPGHGFGVDTHWQQEFEAAFEYELTSDQRSALADIKRDMERPSTMDRLLCGDVGYGKTEVALRAAFKALMDGKQVAVLTPTTVLAFQHGETIRERFASFPVRVAVLSRFLGRPEQKAVLKDLEAGRVDLIVGTHRLLSKDVKFRDFGLLIVDEEQRFGVAHKERIKQMRRQVDVLTLTATPIPRTLNMSLAGIRDMSVIETPPRDRMAIQTSVVRFDAQVIARAIRTELGRGGQVYVVHNRVETIDSFAGLIGRLVPEARLAVAHGQTSEVALERTMIAFVAHQYDVLVATTIIENGLDIPNVNTIVVNHAERYGLAQLYQLRGRVGRSDRRAYAYLVVPAENALSPIARRRLAAIREFSDLGSGFRVAALDLEIRGAGNLLGAQQSGHIEAIGFDMYVKLLEQTVRELQGEEVPDERKARVNLGIDLRVDERYVTETDQRLAVYRKVATAADEPALAAALEEVADRYGPLDPSLVRLAEYGRVRVRASRLGVDAIDREASRLAIRFGERPAIDPGRLIEFVASRPGVGLTPAGVIRLDLGIVRDAGTAADARRAASGTTAGVERDLELLARVNACLEALGEAR